LSAGVVLDDAFNPLYGNIMKRLAIPPAQLPIAAPFALLAGRRNCLLLTRVLLFGSCAFDLKCPPLPVAAFWVMNPTSAGLPTAALSSRLMHRKHRRQSCWEELGRPSSPLMPVSSSIFFAMLYHGTENERIWLQKFY
jgi:hypothetical protein